jgi:biopolymer transport protein ExbB
MTNVLIQGGPLLWFIMIGGLAALVIFLERWFHIHRAKIKTEDFINGIQNILSRGNIAEALTICKETPGPVAQIIRAAVMHSSQQPAMINQAIDGAAFNEISRLERHFATLATIAQIAPVIGLLGTVVGMIQSFMAMQQKAPLVPAADLAGGVWTAMITTAAGLIVAVFAYFTYNLLVAKTSSIVLDMEKAANEITGFLIDQNASKEDHKQQAE